MNNCFAQRLKELIKTNGCSQDTLAHALNVKQQTVSKYVRGVNEPDLDTLLAIARYFGVTVDYLIDPDEDLR